MVSFYAEHKMLVWITAVSMTAAVCLIYYIVFNPRIKLSKENCSTALVRRFGIREWIFHWLILIGFVTLAVTGFLQVMPSLNPSHLGPFHGWLGFVFFLFALITLLGWSRDALFKPYDWPWLLKMGGYLSRQPQHLPAGRFNAGQKVYYWSILLVLIGLLASAVIMEHGSHSPEGRQGLFWCIHGLLGCIATVMVMGHGFLSLFVNPDTARVLRDGRVSKAYIDKHHPLWKIPQ